MPHTPLQSQADEANRGGTSQPRSHLSPHDCADSNNAPQQAVALGALEMTNYQNTPDEFARQLKDGHYNELRVALHFMLEKCLTRIAFAGGRYDIEIVRPDAKSFHVEVKWDKRAGTTGNLYFEVENTRQSRPSGVMATTADLWCHVLGDGREALFIDVPYLKELLNTGQFKSVVTTGIDSNSRGLLVPRERLAPREGVRLVTLPTVEEFFGEVFRLGVSV